MSPSNLQVLFNSNLCILPITTQNYKKVQGMFIIFMVDIHFRRNKRMGSYIDKLEYNGNSVIYNLNNPVDYLLIIWRRP